MRCLFLMLAVSVCLSSSVHASGILEGWAGDVFAGYSLSNGNTDKSSANLSGQARRSEEGRTILLKGSLSYSEANDKMDTQKWEALAKYMRDFGREDRWFSFCQVFVDHDYFADIDYRVTPSAGVGYHIARGEDWAWDADAGLGYRVTRYRSNSALDDEEMTAILHTFLKKRVFERAFLSEDLTAYPGLESGSGVVIRSETVFSNPLSEKMDLELRYILDHNSEAASGKKKTDTQFVAGLKYKF